MTKEISVLGIDLAKTIFQLDGANSHGKRVLKKRLNREKFITYMANLPPCIVGFEACGSSHYWARKFQSYGHEVRMIAPQFVKPFVMSNKNDANDARAISEAIVRPEMRFVPIKTITQQESLLAHKARKLAVKSRSSLANQLRGLLLEFGITINEGIKNIQILPEILENKENKLGERGVLIFTQLYEDFKEADKRVAFYSGLIEQDVKNSPQCEAIMKIEGIGPLTASAMVAAIGNGSVFKNGREVAAWLGLVPRQHSSGHKTRLGGISKRGDVYLRTLLIHGARAVIRHSGNKTDKKSLWINALKERSSFNKAAVALANKNARTIWAILSTGECYRCA